MPINAVCPECQTAYLLADQQAGKTVRDFLYSQDKLHPVRFWLRPPPSLGILGDLFTRADLFGRIPSFTRNLNGAICNVFVMRPTFLSRRSSIDGGRGH